MNLKTSVGKLSSIALIIESEKHLNLLEDILKKDPSLFSPLGMSALEEVLKNIKILKKDIREYEN